MNEKHRAFVTALLKDPARDPATAYGKVYPTAKGKARRNGAARLMANQDIRQLLTGRAEKIAEAADLDVAKWLRTQQAIAFGDRRELMQVKVHACRHCHGLNHLYQRTLAEFNKAHEEWLDARRAKRKGTPAEFDELGGVGWNPRALPAQACPECAGYGIHRVVLTDTDNLSPEAVAMFDGVMETQHGTRVITAGRQTALEAIGKHAGLFAADNNQKAPPLVEAVQALLQGMQGGGGGRLVHSSAPRVLALPAPGAGLKKAP